MTSVSEVMSPKRMPGEVTISFEFRRHIGPRYVHGSVTIRFESSTAFEFHSLPKWPAGDDYTAAIEKVIRETLSARGVLDQATCTLLSVGWDEVSSCKAGFEAAARAATKAAFEV